jgi:catechol 2,3-dioxygenase-like lactoylglutathione lyase family enzyme
MSSLGGMHHVGLTVRDIEVSLAFYRDVLGGTVTSSGTGSGPGISAAVRVPDARMRYAFLDFGPTQLELLSYDNERRTEYDLQIKDVGAPHVCFHVDDIAATYAELERAGVRFWSEPFVIETGEHQGCAFVYFSDPDGLPLELYQCSHH